jgi:hypothetical protein
MYKTDTHEISALASQPMFPVAAIDIVAILLKAIDAGLVVKTTGK